MVEWEFIAAMSLLVAFMMTPIIKMVKENYMFITKCGLTYSLRWFLYDVMLVIFVVCVIGTSGVILHIMLY